MFSLDNFVILGKIQYGYGIKQRCAFRGKAPSDPIKAISISFGNIQLGVIVAEEVRQLLGIRKKTETGTGTETGKILGGKSGQ